MEEKQQIKEEKCPCPYCGQSYYVVKARLNRTGSQRMRCQSCKLYFTPQPKPMGYDQATIELAVRLYLEGSSLRGIGKVLNISHVSVINWVNAHERTLPQQVANNMPTDIVETDELFTYIAQKKRVYVVVSVARESRLIVGAEVMKERSLEKMQGFADELPPAGRYCSDELSVYGDLWWPENPRGGNSTYVISWQGSDLHYRRSEHRLTYIPGQAKT